MRSDIIKKAIIAKTIFCGKIRNSSMSQFSPHVHHRKSIRLKGYDYAKAGMYFITICCQDRACRFGKIENGEMQLNDAGRMIKKWYYELENKYPDKRCHEIIVMPNHIHCIIEKIRDAHVGTPLRGRPVSNDERGRPVSNDERGRPVSNDERGRPVSNDERGHPVSNDERGRPVSNDERGRPVSKYGIDNKKYGATIGDAMDWFKTMTTNEYIRGVKTLKWERFNGKLWQRNYYERIIRNNQSYQRIAKYIINNPSKWPDDQKK